MHDNTRYRCVQHARDELREFAIAEDGGETEFLHVNLIQDFARGGERLHKNRLLICDVIWNEMQIFQRQSEIFGEGAVVRDDAENGAARAMRFQAAAAKIAHRLEAMRRDRKSTRLNSSHSQI